MSFRPRMLLTMTLALVASMVLAVGAAQAIVVDMKAVGQSSVPFVASDQSGYYGVALVPGTCSDLWDGDTCGSLSSAGVPRVTLSAPCTDPALTPDLTLSGEGLCSHGGPVLAANETFALTWDPDRAYWSGTKGYIEQFLRDVADGSGSFSSPYAVTPQYTDAGGRAQNRSKFGGGCVDDGAGAGTACEFASAMGPGHDYPSNGCHPTGDSFVGPGVVATNPVCLTDAQLQEELATMIPQTAMIGRTQPGYGPVVTLLLPAGVETCLDASARLCSANGSLIAPPSNITANTLGGELAPGTYQVKTAYVNGNGEQLASAAQSLSVSGSTSSISIDSPPPANGATGWYAYVMGPGQTSFNRIQRAPSQIGVPITLTALSTSGIAPPQPPFFCAYHSQVDVAGTEVPYVVQPWTAATSCDEPDVPVIQPHPTPQELATAAGQRLVSPLSQAQIAAIVNPRLNSWFALDGSEINDNQGCVPLADQLDAVTVGGGSYFLQREFNNGAAIVSDPATYGGCAPDAILSPAFVVPSSVDQGDEVQFDGTATASTLVVPDASYAWDFGDGTAAVGPSVVHSYSTTGTYSVKLTVTDRGGNVRSLTQTIEVLGPNGEPPVTATGAGVGTGAGAGPNPSTGTPTRIPTTATTPTTPVKRPPGPRLKVKLQLMPQALTGVLRSGLTVVVSSNERADGLAQISIPRSAAKRVHLKAGRGPSLVIAQGTVSGIANGKTTLHLRLSRSVSSKLKALRHVVLTVRIALSATGGQHYAADVAGHY